MVKKWSKSCQKVAKSCQKSCQKVVNVVKKLSKSCQKVQHSKFKVQNSTNSDGERVLGSFADRPKAKKCWVGLFLVKVKGILGVFVRTIV
jgi:hypothetical protein